MSDDEAAVRQYLGEMNPEAMLADGLEEAIAGVMVRVGNSGPVALYDWRKCIDIFVAEGCTEEEAQEHFEFNVLGAWGGDGTTAFMMGCDLIRLGGGADGLYAGDNVSRMLEACEEKLKLRGEE